MWVKIKKRKAGMRKERKRRERDGKDYIVCIGRKGRGKDFIFLLNFSYYEEIWMLIK